jgi:hypothetical protein
MSSTRSVSAVTAAIRNLLDLGMRDNPAGTLVTARPPDRARGTNGGNQLNVFLYQTGLSAAWRNADMPLRVQGGESGAPPLPLVLYYLLTAYGENDEDIVGHQVLGRAMSILHDHPILSPDEIGRALGAGPEVPPILDQIEGIRITFQPMSLEEMSKLWTTLQTQYRISTAYQVSVVLIDSSAPAKTPLPVLRQGADGRGPSATPDLTPPFPALTDVIAPPPGISGERGDTLTLRGHHFDGVSVEVRFHHRELNVSNALAPRPGAGATEISVQIPDDAATAGDWPAGLYVVAVAVTQTTGSQSVERLTNELPFALAPHISSISPANPVARDAQGAVTLTLAFGAPLHRGQRAALLLGDREVLPQAVAGDPPLADTLVFVVPTVTPGEYFVRVRFSGVDSILVDRSSADPRFDERQKVVVQ